MDFLKNLPSYEPWIYLLSALGTLLFALVLYSLLKRAISPQEKRWAVPFARTFWVLAALYAVLIITYRVYNTTAGSHVEHGLGYLFLQSLIPCFSAMTNYLFFISGSRLWETTLDFDKEASYETQSHEPIKEHRIKVGKKSISKRHLKLALGVVLILSALLQIAALAKGLPKWAEEWAAFPDDVLSFIALIYMGVALYQNSKSRRERLLPWERVITWLGLLSSIGYAIIYFLWGMGELRRFVERTLPGASEDDLKLIPSLLVSLISLPFKFWIFYSGYSLLLLISGPLQGIETLLDKITRGEKELLDKDGILRSVWEELHAERVGLFIKLPGVEENMIEHHEFPPRPGRMSQDPTRFTLQPNELYDKVMKSGITKIKPLPGESRWAAQKPSKVGVPVYFHDSVIACLEVSIGKGKFTKVDRVKLERIATLIALALQAYREMFAINKITDDAGRLQIEVQNYDMKRDVDEITRIIHNVISSLSTGISIEMGFEEYKKIEPEKGPLDKPTRRQLDAKDGDKVAEDARVDRRWLSNELKFMDKKVGKQVLGKFILATDKVSRRRQHPTLGTNESFLLAVSDLATDTLLDFTRGRLNQLTDLLGKRLNSQGVRTPADWCLAVEKTAQEAGLSWAVVSYSDGEDGMIGDESAVKLVRRLEQPDLTEKWDEKEDGFWLYSLDEQEANAYHVIRKSLVDSVREQDEPPATLWLGVEREGFGQELRYISPWEFFLFHFCEIASTALHRLREIEYQKKRMGEVQSIIAGTLIVGPLTHNLASVGRSLGNTAEELMSVGVDESNRDVLMEDLRRQREKINSLLPKIEEIYEERDLHQPCPLDEVVERAVERVESYSAKFDVRIEKCVPAGLLIDVPFDGAASTLAIVIENAKEAIGGMLGKGKSGKGLIRIGVRETEDKIICDVVDSGPGIPDRLRGRLLKEVCKNNTKENSHGVGLLFSAHLLRYYEGDIKITEFGPEPNTTVSIYFPKYLSRQ